MESLASVGVELKQIRHAKDMQNSPAGLGESVVRMLAVLNHGVGLSPVSESFTTGPVRLSPNDSRDGTKDEKAKM